ncbi:MAG: flagellar type III secretion system pore protein FliP [Acidobacteria bacterium]|nr:flagellar type III secretion system pore protein FliP [Acidobacteriota bacterium]
MIGRALAALLLLCALAGVAAAQGPTPPTPPSLPSLTITGAPQNLSIPLQILLLLTLLTLLPAALASLTPFLRILIVLHFLRQAIGTQTAPGNQTLLGLSLFLTIVVMQPTADQVYRDAIQPLERGEIGQLEALDKAQQPLKAYLMRFAREEEVALFLDITGRPRPSGPADLELTVLAPAYMLSEMKAAFQIGAVLFLPFLIIDLLAASITLSLGMIQLPPIMISTPFKLLLFVLADGWNLVVGSLVRGVS